MKRKIGHAKERNSLYFMENQDETVEVEDSLPLSFLLESVISKSNKIWFYHHHLGRTSFSLN